MKNNRTDGNSGVKNNSLYGGSIMKDNLREACSIMKINFRQLLPAYVVTAVFTAVGVYNLIACLTGMTDNYYVDMANYFYVLSVMGPVMIAARNFSRIMYLNGSRKGFYWGSLLNYCIIAAVVSLAGILFYVVTDGVFGPRLVILNLVDVFGWWKNGPFLAFIQQFFFLLLVQTFFHTLASIQNKWYGWLTDGAIAVVLCVFIPVPGLRRLLVGFFQMIIFHSSPFMQIISCLSLSTAIYLMYWFLLGRKELP